MDKRTALGVIEQALARLGELAGNGLDEGAMDTWQRTTSSDLRRVFEDVSDLHRQFEEIDWGPNRVLDVSDPEGTHRLIREGLERGARAARSVLEAALHEIGHWSEEAPDESAFELNEAARRVLRVFHHYYEQEGDRRWAIAARHASLDQTGLDPHQRKRAFSRLVERRLIEPYTAGGNHRLTETGALAADQPEILDELLPLRRATTNEHEPATGAVPCIDFIEDASMDAIVKSDLRELDGALRHRLHKSAVLLCGSILEAVLIDVLDRRRDLASSYLKKKKFPDDASLDDLLLVAGNEGLVSETARQVGVAVKDHRDLIHPHRQARERVAVDGDTAQAMLVLLRLVVRDLRRAHEDGRVKTYVDK